MDVDKLRADAKALGLYLNAWPEGGTLNITTLGGREMARADVDAFRALLTEAGLEEVESWIAWQGASWLSDGLFAGVSFKVRPVQ